MAGKKSFAGQQNPALAFISAQEDAPDQVEGQTIPAAKPAGKASKEPERASTRKGGIKTTDAPKGYKANPLYVETKSRRMQLLVQPSLHEALKARAAAEGCSVNELVHTLLEEALKEG